MTEKKGLERRIVICLSQCPWSIGQLSFLQKLLHHQFIFICVFLGLGVAEHACTVNNRMEVLKIEKYTFNSKTGGKHCHSIVQTCTKNYQELCNFQ